MPVAFKLDYLMPSGSFKDRGTAVLLSRLRELGVTSIHEDSSGNSGASIATYAAAAGFDCTVYVPAQASPAKLVQIKAAGVRLVTVPGTRQDTAKAAMEAAARGISFYASHNWQPLFIEGVKTVAYELWEQNGWSSPDAVVAPLGYGSTVLGLYRGFKELLSCGSVTRLPRIFACQAEACAPFYRAFVADDPTLGYLDPEDVRPTMAEGVASARPIRTVEVLQAVKESGGAVVAVPEGEIREAVFELARMGFYVEPTAATAPAAYLRLAASGAFQRHENVVVILTGSGLKATDLIGRLLDGEEIA